MKTKKMHLTRRFRSIETIAKEAGVSPVTVFRWIRPLREDPRVLCELKRVKSRGPMTPFFRAREVKELYD